MPSNGIGGEKALPLCAVFLPWSQVNRAYIVSSLHRGLREPQQLTELLGQLMALLQVDEMWAFALNVKGSDPAGG